MSKLKVPPWTDLEDSINIVIRFENSGFKISKNVTTKKMAENYKLDVLSGEFKQPQKTIAESHSQGSFLKIFTFYSNLLPPQGRASHPEEAP